MEETPGQIGLHFSLYIAVNATGNPALPSSLATRQAVRTSSHENVQLSLDLDGMVDRLWSNPGRPWLACQAPEADCAIEAPAR
jgi:hypothetical protein